MQFKDKLKLVQKFKFTAWVKEICYENRQFLSPFRSRSSSSQELVNYRTKMYSGH